MVSNSNDGTGMGGATKGRHQQLPIGDDDVFSLLQRSSNVPPFMTSLVTALKVQSNPIIVHAFSSWLLTQ